MNPVTKFKNWVFSKVHGNKLIYNTCWEDPRCDRMLLNLDNDSEIVMITSAGCNALDYLLDSPAKINCVDMNHRQNALLELKQAAISNLDFDTFFSMFGQGSLAQASSIYNTKLRRDLPVSAQKYWDRYIKYFSGKGWRRSFYYRGTSGLLAYGVTRLLKMKKQIRTNLIDLFEAVSLTEQRFYFSQVEGKVFNRFVKLLLNNHYTMTLAGVPRNQQLLIEQSYKGGAMEYIQESFRKIFTTLDVSDNYFYQLYFNGSYTKTCCPEYLKNENYEKLKKQVDRVETHHATISDFLEENPGNYSHFVLLDHQDWLASNRPEELKREWQLILKNSRPGTRILMRSAAKEIGFFPDFVKASVDFNCPITEEAHDLDRVGTYASVYLGVVR